MSREEAEPSGEACCTDRKEARMACCRWWWAGYGAREQRPGVGVWGPRPDERRAGGAGSRRGPQEEVPRRRSLSQSGTEQAEGDQVHCTLLAPAEPRSRATLTVTFPAPEAQGFGSFPGLAL